MRILLLLLLLPGTGLLLGLVAGGIVRRWFPKLHLTLREQQVLFGFEKDLLVTFIVAWWQRRGLGRQQMKRQLRCIRRAAEIFAVNGWEYKLEDVELLAEELLLREEK